ncbi:MAG: gamma carbonic anhydrase family protein [Woeseiaceae bacterium]|nr:gamma carbonic anhydrase family protein [Woeseiaceae bacterium]
MIYALGERNPIIEGSDHFIAANATLIGSIRLGHAVSVWFNCVLRGDNDWIEIGARSNIQDNSVLHTDPGLKLTIGEGVTVGHRVMLHGCTIGDNSLIGIGSTVLNGARIGKNCVVGAHSLITENKEFPDNSLIIGSPARKVRTLGDDDIKMLKKSAEIYVANAERFNESLRTL